MSTGFIEPPTDLGRLLPPVVCRTLIHLSFALLFFNPRRFSMNSKLAGLLAGALFVSFGLFFGCSSQPALQFDQQVNSATAETVKAGQFDTGKMWTFDFPPVEYFAKTYNFIPTQEWFDKARLAALRLPGCSAAFVSEDGLVMTNHHCVRGTLPRIQKEGEKLVENGFYADSLSEERKAPVYIDQLIVMEDVTKEVLAAFDSGSTDSAKTAGRTAKISEIQKRFSRKFKETTQDSMVFNVYSFYNGGRYSLYGYKRYTDVRLVFAPEEKAAFFGGDPDNFTYPRYDFDCSFYRVYEHDRPLKTSNFFRFSKNGAADGETVFVIGNPGTTNRLLTVAQLETLRDYQYPTSIGVSSSRMKVMTDYVAKHPEKRGEFLNQIFGVANGLKANTGVLGGLRDPYLMAKKRDFENQFKNAVLGSTTLSSRYGNPWKEISELEAQRRTMMWESSALSTTATRSQYITMPGRIIDRAFGPAGGGRPPAEGRGGRGAIYPDNFTQEIETRLLGEHLRFMKEKLGEKNEALNSLLNGRTPEQAAEYLAKATSLGSKQVVDSLAKAKPDQILNSTDPLIVFLLTTRPRATELQARLADIREKQSGPSQRLGRAMYAVYGTTIPPDATFSLRIADGVVKGYQYNGTYAPAFTTFYGLYDRYYSFGKQDPWLPGDRWLNPPADFSMSTPMNFVSTNDIIGGNSGSSIINKNHEVVGLIFDGNMESLPGNIIYDELKNRSVAVHSSGILEGMEKIYKAGRIANELKAGKIVP